MDLNLLFDWDTANVEHITLHDITPEEVEQVIKTPLLILVAECETVKTVLCIWEKLTAVDCCLWW